MYQHKLRIFDYPRFAEPFRNRPRENAERLAADNGIEIEHIRKKNFRKEERIQEVLAKRGDKPGLLWIFSAMEPCATYKPWHDKETAKTYLKPDDGKCLHYYFYFPDEELGLGYVRLPTWLPCRLQIYFNGHNWLAAQLKKRKIDYRLLDNAFLDIADWEQAQRIADGWQAKRIHWKLDELVQRFCPIFRDFGVAYHWSVDQCEYATDIAFRRQADLQAIYGNLTRTAIHTVKPDNIATFLGKQLVPQFEGEMGNRFNLRIEGTREAKWAPMQKTVYSLPALRELLVAANRRYLEFLSTIDDPGAGIDQLNRVSRTVHHNDRSYPGFNFLDDDDQMLFEALARGEFNISGLQSETLRPHLSGKSSGQMSRLLNRNFRDALR